MPNSSSRRFAVYYTPPVDHPLTQAAVRWLGRDAIINGQPTRVPLDDAEHLALTAEPRRYGFHATIKPPFRLRPECSVANLEQAIREFCATRAPHPIGALSIARIGRFFALVPIAPFPSLKGLAAQAVSELDRFRAPMNQAELERRLRSRLDDVETTNLVRWGYPYVFDRFRFHMTLTGPVAPDRQDAVRQHLEDTFSPLIGQDFLLDTLSLFAQEGPDADFAVQAQFPMRSSRAVMRVAG